MMGDWTFFSNYGHVLVCLARNREARLRDVAHDVGITERAVQKIVRDLQEAGFVEVTKQGRCNRYRINRRKSLRHALESHCTIGKLLALVGREERDAASSDASEAEPAGRAKPPLPQTAGRDVMPGAPPRAADAHGIESGGADSEDAARPPMVRQEADAPAASPSPEPATEPTTEQDSKKKRSPADTREQGSLF